MSTVMEDNGGFSKALKLKSDLRSSSPQEDNQKMRLTGRSYEEIQQMGATGELFN